uniref:Secreted protein n=1 Tax=Elaeophora elaphi TaxID=1147741 RepID=A0A0R3RFH3_9BILA
MKYCQEDVTCASSQYLFCITEIKIFLPEMMTMTIRVPSVRILPLSSLLIIAAITTTSHQYYDPTMRDYVEACDEMAQLAGDNFCRVFDICCRDRAKNKLNGDRCQLTDPTNGCQLTPEGNVEFLRCRAYNCTPEVTTTTTTTTTTARALLLSSSSTGINAGALITVIAFAAAFQLSLRQYCHWILSA